MEYIGNKNNRINKILIPLKIIIIKIHIGINKYIGVYFLGW